MERAPDTIDASVSIVSHGQGGLAGRLLEDLAAAGGLRLEVIYTANIPEADGPQEKGWPFPVTRIDNRRPKGFAANHNAAFRRAAGRVFCVVNPDIHLRTDPFPEIVALLSRPGVGIVSPLVLEASGEIADFARRFPTPLTPLLRRIRRQRGPDYDLSDEGVSPDWVAGMFMSFTRETYGLLGGFDERFYLYCEDVDICVRARHLGLSTRVAVRAAVVHEARRASRRQPKLMLLHALSLARYFLQPGAPRS